MGCVRFQFRHGTARAVAVAGDFNSWDVAAHTMQRSADGPWILEVDLPPGRYEYKFFVYGEGWTEWWNDPNAPKVPNMWGSENSYVDVR